MKPIASVTKDDVALLVRGKPSRKEVGSRQIRHRLRHDELRRLEIARTRGFLLLTQTTRNALRNAWHLDCQARSSACVFVERSGSMLVVTADLKTQIIKAEAPDLASVSRYMESL